MNTDLKNVDIYSEESVREVLAQIKEVSDPALYAELIDSKLIFENTTDPIYSVYSTFVLEELVAFNKRDLAPVAKKELTNLIEAYQDNVDKQLSAEGIGFVRDAKDILTSYVETGVVPAQREGMMIVVNNKLQGSNFQLDEEPDTSMLDRFAESFLLEENSSEFRRVMRRACARYNAKKQGLDLETISQLFNRDGSDFESTTSAKALKQHKNNAGLHYRGISMTYAEKIMFDLANNTRKPNKVNNFIFKVPIAEKNYTFVFNGFDDLTKTLRTAQAIKLGTDALNGIYNGEPVETFYLTELKNGKTASNHANICITHQWFGGNSSSKYHPWDLNSSNEVLAMNGGKNNLSEFGTLCGQDIILKVKLNLGSPKTFFGGKTHFERAMSIIANDEDYTLKIDPSTEKGIYKVL